jgi:hypothetical protein
MTGYYYRDPLVAAYMLRHGLLFEDLAVAFCHHSVHAGLSGLIDRRSFEVIDGRVADYRFYVLPCSLPLLEPQVGDRDGDGFVWDGGKWQCPFRLPESRESRTTWRGGKPFFWPESD